MTDTIREQLRKIAALASRGVDGERMTAKAMLDRLLAKHGLTLDDLEDTRTSLVLFYAAGERRMFLVQIACKVLNSSTVTCSRSGRSIWLRLTRLQGIEVSQLMAIMWPAWLKKRRRLVKMARIAFITRNHLHSDQPADDAPDPKPLSPEERFLLRSLYMGMQPVVVRKALNPA